MTDTVLLLATAAGVALAHTLAGPDHYLPFVSLARAQGWSARRLLGVTLACGLAHVLSSVALGLAGVALGVTLASLQQFQETRGAWAAWALIAFGLAYGAWGMTRGRRAQCHSHLHVHADGAVHAHAHDHHSEHLHVHAAPQRRGWRAAGPLLLFAIFLLGPCEPMIPLMMYPAAQGDWTGTAAVIAVFSVTTLATMAAMALGWEAGLRRLRLRSLESYGHALAGAAILACGLAMTFLGL